MSLGHLAASAPIFHHKQLLRREQKGQRILSVLKASEPAKLALRLRPAIYRFLDDAVVADDPEAAVAAGNVACKAITVMLDILGHTKRPAKEQAASKRELLDMVSAMPTESDLVPAEPGTQPGPPTE